MSLVCYWVMIASDRAHPYLLPEVTKCRVVRQTPHTVRLQRTDGTEFSQPIWDCFCLPTRRSWDEFNKLYRECQAAFNDLAEGVRRLGRYDQVLKQSPHPANPLTPWVIAVCCPDKDWQWSATGSMWWSAPSLQRLDAGRHTAKMIYTLLDGKQKSTRRQDDCFICPDEAAWKTIEALHLACEFLSLKLTTYIHQLGTYGSNQGLDLEVEDWSDEPVIATVRSIELEGFKVGDRVTPKHSLGSRYGVIEGFRKNPKTPVIVRWLDDGGASGYWGAGALLLDESEIAPGGSITTASGSATVTHAETEGEIVFATYGGNGVEQPHVIEGIVAVEPDPLDELTTPLAEIVNAEPLSDDPELDWLACRINMKHSECNRLVAQALYAARDAGRMLIEVRSKCKQQRSRNWLKWLDDNFEGSQRSAYNYIAIAENWHERIEPELEPNALIGVGQALRLLSATEADLVGEVEPEIQPIPPRDKALTVTLEPGDYVQVIADDDQFGRVAIVARTLPSFEIEIDFDDGLTLAYARHQLKPTTWQRGNDTGLNLHLEDTMTQPPDDADFYNDPVVLYDPIAGPVTDSQLTAIVNAVHEESALHGLPPINEYQVALERADTAQMQRINRAVNYMSEGMQKTEANLGHLYAAEWIETFSRLQRAVIRNELRVIRRQIAEAEVGGDDLSE